MTAEAFEAQWLHGLLKDGLVDAGWEAAQKEATNPFDPASFPRTPSHAANRLRSFVTGAMYPMAVCMRTRL